MTVPAALRELDRYRADTPGRRSVQTGPCNNRNTERHPSGVQHDSPGSQKRNTDTGKRTGSVWGIEGTTMARRQPDIKIRIERQETKILKLTKQLEEEKDRYEALLEEQKEEDKKKLFEAYSKSKRSLNEVIDFMKGRADI